MRISDCSSDVCSSDLCEVTEAGGGRVDAFNRAFHLALLQAAGQPITVNFLERLHVLSERYVRKHLEPLGRDERANEEHHQMLDAWLAHDLDRLRALTVAHIQKTPDDLRQQHVAAGACRIAVLPD